MCPGLAGARGPTDRQDSGACKGVARTWPVPLLLRNRQNLVARPALRQTPRPPARYQEESPPQSFKSLATNPTPLRLARTRVSYPRGVPGAVNCVAPGTWAELAAFKARSTSQGQWLVIGRGGACSVRVGALLLQRQRLRLHHSGTRTSTPAAATAAATKSSDLTL